MIKVSGLYKAINGQDILQDINLEVEDGEILVILGQSGAGKSVLLQHLMGLRKPDKGNVVISGVDITNLSERDLLRVRKNIGYLFQEGALYDFMDVYENLAFPLEEHTDLNEGQISQRIKNVLQTVGLEGVEGKYPVELSGGMRKRVALARAVILNSKILFCDEPTSGLDPIRSRDISDLIRNLSKQLQCTTVVTSHDVANSFRIADRLALIHEGRLIAVGIQGEIASSKDPFVRQFFKN
ncbi:MAG TPA: ATP-binding cassette domain-containing protein [Candidatus Omnitrophota bacterium]|nr:ATP-binding cassette domain-containing protein [Candidatus Omnitrophota bacterium]HPD84212.1 ATP-binding cassette domain-containing protein [Candidatus Omnitrophota bacterium]HRZ03068.1 ATP-binding cassette domain-containing protein [Candidatus Omnitrophota bacterium]